MAEERKSIFPAIVAKITSIFYYTRGGEALDVARNTFALGTKQLKSHFGVRRENCQFGLKSFTGQTEVPGGRKTEKHETSEQSN